ncbi:MAG TPA: ParB N-terminal domain-containing protein [Baekduia sp.]|nr:ParB N-terminal domain-containing protein [Baekduia sp.]
MSQVDKLQQAEEEVAQLREESARAEREARAEDLRRAPLADTAGKAHRMVTAPLAQVRTMVNMRVGPLPDLHELAISIRETGLLHPPLVRETGLEGQPYELLAGRRRFGALKLIDEAEGPQEWRFTVVEGISRREALTMQFAENFHQHKPEPVQFARAARAIMAEDESLTAAEVSRMVGAPLTWTRKALRLLDLPESIVERVEQGDLAFTVADLVRRGIARGDVSAEEATELVEQHAEGQISGGALKLGVGYVPPKPKDYDEQSRKLDEARWAQQRDGGDRGMDAEQRDWESASGGPEPRDRRDVVGGGPEIRVSRREPTAGDAAVEVEPEDLDGYLLSLVLTRLATDEHRAVLRLADAEQAQAYAFSLRPEERLGLLRSLAAELLAADPNPPRALKALLAA